MAACPGPSSLGLFLLAFTFLDPSPRWSYPVFWSFHGGSLKNLIKIEAYVSIKLQENRGGGAVGFLDDQQIEKPIGGAFHLFQVLAYDDVSIVLVNVFIAVLKNNPKQLEEEKV